MNKTNIYPAKYNKESNLATSFTFTSYFMLFLHRQSNLATSFTFTSYLMMFLHRQSTLKSQLTSIFEIWQKCEKSTMWCTTVGSLISSEDCHFQSTYRFSLKSYKSNHLDLSTFWVSATSKRVTHKLFWNLNDCKKLHFCLN